MSSSDLGTHQLDHRSSLNMSLYELHITVELSPLDEMRWIWICNDLNFKPIRVVNDKGENRIQNMMSKYCSRETSDEAIVYIKQIEDELDGCGFNVCRIKVEGMMMDDQFKSVVLTEYEDYQYWEFHFKIRINKAFKLQRLVDWKRKRVSKGDDCIALSMKTSGTTKYPIITIRIHTGTRDEAIQKKNEVIDSLKKAGFHVNGKIQMEYVIYDNNQDYDAGWFGPTY